MSGIGSTTYSTAQLQNIATQAAGAYGIPQNLFNQLVTTESNWQTGIVSSAGAIGLGQLKPSTASGLNYNGSSVNPYDPTQNLYGSAEYLAQLYNQFGSWSAAVSAYNTGPGAYQQGVQPAANYAPVLSIAQQLDEANGNTGGLGFSISPDQANNSQFYVPGTDTPIDGGAEIGLGTFALDGSSTSPSNVVAGTPATTNTSTGLLGSIGSGLTSAFGSVETWISSVVGRIGIFVLAIIIILTALIIYGIQSNKKELIEAAKVAA